MYANQNMDGNVPQWPMNQGMVQMPQMPAQAPVMPEAAEQPDMEEGDNSHRPPNAFILYSQAMRSQVRQENPSLSNTEVSRLLGKMWKEVPNEIKLQYKQKAAAMQEEFKREHPDYTYRKARRKRALNELLTKSSSNFTGFPMVPPGGFPPSGDMSQFAQNPMMGFGLQGFGQLPGAPQPGADANGAAGQPGAAASQPGQAPMQFQGMGAMPMAMSGMPMGMNQMTPLGQNNMYANMNSFGGQK